MAKQKKKRNKVYKGADAAITKPSVMRVSAVNRNKVSQWWFDNKRIAKPVGIGVGVTVVVAILIFEAIRLIVK